MQRLHSAFRLVGIQSATRLVRLTIRVGVRWLVDEFDTRLSGLFTSQCDRWPSFGAFDQRHYLTPQESFVGSQFAQRLARMAEAQEAIE